MGLSNRLLRDSDRRTLKWAEDYMKTLRPDMVARKIPRAHIQEVAMFVALLGLFEHSETSYLCAGACEDTASACLRALGIGNLVETDPNFGISPPTTYNLELHAFLSRVPSQYDVVFATSVLEHTRDDEEFIADMCSAVKPGGYGLLTCDFLDTWKPGQPIPPGGGVLYTIKDFTKRFFPILKKFGCELCTDYNWSGEPDFDYGCSYSFATLSFRKNTNRDSLWVNN